MWKTPTIKLMYLPNIKILAQGRNTVPVISENETISQKPINIY